jgi:hypothetical protein
MQLSSRNIDKILQLYRFVRHWLFEINSVLKHTLICTDEGGGKGRWGVTLGAFLNTLTAQFGVTIFSTVLSCKLMLA